jgi:hypothetical protein
VTPWPKRSADLATVELARLPEAVAEAVNAQAVADAEPVLRLYDRDHQPNAPVEPYGVIDYTLTGRPWDRSLLVDESSGIVAFVVTGVGDRRSAALWILDVFRRVLARVNPADVALTGTTRVTCMWSSGSPSPPDEVGDLVTVTETYYAHVEAT